MRRRFAPESGLRSVPLILLGGAEDWPEWLDPVTDERWTHILVRHGPGSTTPGPNFKPDTDIPTAVFDTIDHGHIGYDERDGKVHTLTVNGQTVVAVMRPRTGDPGRFFLISAFPRE